MVDIEKAVIEGALAKHKHKTQLWVRAIVIVITTIIPLFIILPPSLRLVSYLFGFKKDNILNTILIFVWVGIVFGIIMYFGLKNVLSLVTNNRLPSWQEMLQLLLIAAPYGIIQLLLESITLLTLLNPKSSFAGYVQLSKFYVLDQWINPITAFKKAKNIISHEQALKLRYIDNYALAHVYRQFNLIERQG